MFNKWFYGCFIALTACAQSNNGNLSAVDFKNRLDSLGANIILLDVRTEEEYVDGHIKDAILMDYNLPNFSATYKTLDSTKPVYVYCLSGGRSGSAAKEMSKNGYKIINLNGGIKAWKSANLPVETGLKSQ